MLAYLASEDPTFITRERADLAANGGRGGRGGGRGGPASARAALNAELYGGRGFGGGRGANVDEKGWSLTCPKAPRFFNDTSHATAPSNRP
jgi:hypothetical protein